MNTKQELFDYIDNHKEVIEVDVLDPSKIWIKCSKIYSTNCKLCPFKNCKIDCHFEMAAQYDLSKRLKQWKGLK